MSRTHRLLLVLPAILFGSTACEELEDFLPTVAFDTMELNDIDFEKAEVDFIFAVDNPNPVSIQLSSFSYGFGFQGIPLLDGTDDDGFAIEEVGSSELRLPVSLAWTDAWDTVQATRGNDDIIFGLDGHMGFDTQTELGEVRLPYETGGDFPAVRRPKFQFKKLRVTELKLLQNKASLALDLDVDNDHGSTLLFENFDYELSLGGKKVGTGLVNRLGEVEGAESRTLTVPFDIDLLSAGQGVVKAITDRNQKLDIGLDAIVDVNLPFLDNAVVPLKLDETGNVSVE